MVENRYCRRPFFWKNDVLTLSTHYRKTIQATRGLCRVVFGSLKFGFCVAKAIYVCT